MTEFTYKNSGVDIEVADQVTHDIKTLAATTHNRGVLQGIGLFSGFFEFDVAAYQKPVLVSSIDGVGTKVKIAQQMGVYDTIGVDLVNHCINDIAVCGAKPLFFTDYIAADRLRSQEVRDIVSGLALACKDADCALVGGETAEMPGVYAKNSFDLAGSVVGVVERNKIIDGKSVRANDILLGISASGVHTNGFSLIRKLLDSFHLGLSDIVPGPERPLGRELLIPHKAYLNLIQGLLATEGLVGIAHVTGGGIVANTNRLLPGRMSTVIDWSAWQVPPVFQLIQEAGNIQDDEMRKVFNLGVGLVLIIRAGRECVFKDLCRSLGEPATVIGRIVEN